MTITKLWPLALLVLILAACGASVEAKPLRVVAETATTRTIDHTFGTTDIPAAPARVLALGEEGLLADLLDGGIRPVASIVNVPDHLPLIAPAEVAGTELLSSSGDLSIEQLLAYNPDLIVGTVFFIGEIGYEQLAAIAPTVAVGAGAPLEAYVETQAIFGRGDEATSEVEAFREEMAAAADEIGTAELEVSVAAIYPGPNVALFVDGPQAAPLLLTRLGVTLLPTGAAREALDPSNGRAFISEERLDLLSGEPLILLQSTAVEGEPEAIAAMSDDPIWNQLPAIRSGRVVTLDRLGYPGFRGQRALLGDLVAALKSDE